MPEKELQTSVHQPEYGRKVALKSAYQRPDEETMLQVVEHDAELREVR